MNEEVLEIVRKLEDGTADYFDVERLGKLADGGDLYAALEYGICLYLGEQVLIDKEKAQSYFEMTIESDDFGVLVELVSFLDYVDPFRFKEVIDIGKEKVHRKIEKKSKELGFDASKLN